MTVKKNHARKSKHVARKSFGLGLDRRRFLEFAVAGVSAMCGGAAMEAAERSHGISILSAPQACNLTCEFMVDPLGIDTAQPRVGWQLAAGTGGRQSAYEILVASDQGILARDQGDLWNSGKVMSADSVQVVYRGRPIGSSTKCYWKVRLWDQNATRGRWSQPAAWETGLLQSTDWRAKWIGGSTIENAVLFDTPPAPYFRYVFQTGKPLRSARAYVCGLGYYELYLNGAKVGDQVLAPAQTDYSRRQLAHLLYPVSDNGIKSVLYNTHDITRHLRPGRNAVGIIIGNGWYNQRARRVEGWMWYGQPRVILQMHLAFTDGSSEIIGTTPQWKVSTGPILQNAIFTGETYDARREIPAWCDQEFNDTAWSNARAIAAPTGCLIPQMAPSDRVVGNLAATALRRPVHGLEGQVFQPKPGVCGFDFGRNFAGWVRLKLRQPAGTKIQIHYIEDSGLRYGQSDIYIAKGLGEEVYEPRFTWHGFRYIEITGCITPPNARAITGRLVHTDVKKHGEFACSNPLLNQIYGNYRRTELAALHGGVPMDCPHRERLGYGADGHVSAQSAMYSFDMHRFYIKWATDFANAQGPHSGFIPHTAPFEGGGGGPAWGAAAILIPWYVYLYYGDSRILETHYDVMKKWVRFLEGCTNSKGIITHEEPGGWCLGDWATPDTIAIPPEFVNTCYLAHLYDLMARIAVVVRRPADIAGFSRSARRAAHAVNTGFLNSTRSGYCIERQGANVFPLAFDIVPLTARRKVLAQLVKHIETTTHCHFDTGILATPLQLEVLTRYGRADLALALMSQTTYPSYGWQITKGATTLWEQWNGMGSHMHPMFGSVCAWFFRDLAGIATLSDYPGFRCVRIRPHLVRGLDWVRAEHNSPFGLIESAWRWHGRKVILNVTIPSGSSSFIEMIGAGRENVQCNGKPLRPGADGVRNVKRETTGDEALRVQVAAGSYRFVYTPHGVR